MLYLKIQLLSLQPSNESIIPFGSPVSEIVFIGFYKYKVECNEY